MKYNPLLHHRASHRLDGWDYTGPGAYFVTLCVKGREWLFGKIVNKEMHLNEFGEIVRQEWAATQEIRPNVIIDEFIVMPNHVHGIIIIRNNPLVGATRPTYSVGATRPTYSVGATRRVAPTVGHEFLESSDNPPPKRPNGPKPGSIGAIIGQCKSIITKRINVIRNTPGVTVWQRDYYDRIGRDRNALFRIRQYIRNNPAKWDYDDENSVMNCGRPTA